MASITVSTPLQKLCGKRRVLPGSGRTVLELISDATGDYPELSRRILTPHGTIGSHILVYVDGRILPDNREQAVVEEGTDVGLLLIVGGG